MKMRTTFFTAMLGSILILGACGGSSSTGGGTTMGANGTISGTVVKGPVSGATVAAFAISNGTMGAKIGAGTTDPAGKFTLTLGDYAGPLMLQASGGTYADEATGSTMPMLGADVMLACVPSIATGDTASGLQVTPLTSMACARAKSMSGGMTAANVTTANTALGTYFSVSDILHTMPMDPTLAGSASGATQDAKNYGMALAAMSQYAKSAGMTASSSGVVTAMMNDASDGVMNGMMGSTSISMAGMGGMMGGTMQSTAGTAALAAAMEAFIGSSMNRSGVQLADMQALMNQLSGSTGQLPGAAGGGTSQGTLSGTAFMGEMTSGTVTAYAVDGGVMGAQLAASTVDSSGNFSLPLGTYSGTVMVQVTDGSFHDEATGTTMALQAGDVLTSCVPSFAVGSATNGVQVTPLTSMAQARAQGTTGGMTAANVSAANAAVGNYFMVSDILMSAPMDPAVAGSASGADQNRKNYGMTIAAMSEYAKTIGMTTSSSGIVAAMMKDATDGVMNGMMGSTSISMSGMGGMSGGGMMGGGTMQGTAGTSGLATAMSAYLGSSLNLSGVSLADMQALIDKLSASSGTIQ